MSKRTVFTTVTPLPAGISRETVMATLHDHLEMIDLNPLVQERHPIKPPGNATAEEYHCQWYSLTDKVAYLPGGLVSGKVSYNACFHDLANGLQTHVYAPMGLNIRGKWSMGGSLPGEPVAPVELGMGVPLQGLYLREDVDMKCNIMMTSFVKKTLKKAHSALVSRIMVRAQIVSASEENERITGTPVLHQSVLARQSTSFSQSSSSHEAQSMAGDPSATSPGFLPHIAHPQPLGFRYDDAFRDEKTPAHDNSLYPKPLKSRTPSPSMNGSVNSSQHGRSSYQGSMFSSPNASGASYQDSREGGLNAGPRVSWNQLGQQGHQRSASMQHIEPSHQNPYNHAHHSLISQQSNQFPTYPNHHEHAQHQDGPPAYQGSVYPQAPQEQHPAFRQTTHQAPPHPNGPNRRSTQPYPEDSHVIQFGRQNLPSQVETSRPPPSHGPVELE